MVRKTTRATAVLHGLSLTISLPRFGIPRLLRKTRTPTLFGGGRFTTFGSIRPRPPPTVLLTSVSLRLDRQLVFRSRLLSCQTRRRRQPRRQQLRRLCRLAQRQRQRRLRPPQRQRPLAQRRVPPRGPPLLQGLARHQGFVLLLRRVHRPGGFERCI